MPLRDSLSYELQTTSSSIIHVKFRGKLSRHETSLFTSPSASAAIHDLSREIPLWFELDVIKLLGKPSINFRRIKQKRREDVYSFYGHDRDCDASREISRYIGLICRIMMRFPCIHVTHVASLRRRSLENVFLSLSPFELRMIGGKLVWDDKMSGKCVCLKAPASEMLPREFAGERWRKLKLMDISLLSFTSAFFSRNV